MMLSMLAFASMDAITKILGRNYSVPQTLWVRYVVFAAFALLVARPLGIGRVAHSKRPLLQTGRALIALLESAVFVLAFHYLPLAETHAVGSTSPLIVIALSVPMLREKAGLHRWLAVGAGFIGVLLIIRPGFETISWPLLLPLGGAFLWGLYQILIRLVARHDPPETTILWSAFAGLLAISVVAPFFWQPPDAFGWFLLICMSIIGSVANYALIKALDFAEAGALQPFSYTLLVWAALLGAAVFGDVPGIWTILGAGVIVLSGLYAWRHDLRAAAATRNGKQRGGQPRV
jgi:drug/metabolite transporter (DMT)-like permease